MLEAGDIDACSVDSNGFRGEVPAGLRRICALGPYPVQPFVYRPGLSAALVRDIAAALLDAGDAFIEFGVTRFVPCSDSLFREGAQSEEGTPAAAC